MENSYKLIVDNKEIAVLDLTVPVENTLHEEILDYKNKTLEKTNEKLKEVQKLVEKLKTTRFIKIDRRKISINNFIRVISVLSSTVSNFKTDQVTNNKVIYRYSQESKPVNDGKEIERLADLLSENKIGVREEDNNNTENGDLQNQEENLNQNQEFHSNTSQEFSSESDSTQESDSNTHQEFDRNTSDSDPTSIKVCLGVGEPSK